MKNLDFIGFPMYAVSVDGQIFSLFTNKFLKPVQMSNGYKSVTLQEWEIKKNFLIHRIVAEAFIPNPDDKPQVNHKDGDKGNNSVANLEWVTPAENTQHAIATGLKTDFKKLDRSLTDDQAHVVCHMIADSWRNCDIAKATGVDTSTVAKIRLGTHYPDISKQYDFSSALSSRRKLSDSKVTKICEMLSRNVKFSVIMRELNVGYATLKKISDREAYKHISNSFVF